MQATGSGTKRPISAAASQTLADCQPSGVTFSLSSEKAIAVNATKGTSHLAPRAAFQIIAVLPMPPAGLPFSILIVLLPKPEDDAAPLCLSAKTARKPLRQNVAEVEDRGHGLATKSSRTERFPAAVAVWFVVSRHSHN